MIVIEKSSLQVKGSQKHINISLSYTSLNYTTVMLHFQHLSNQVSILPRFSQELRGSRIAMMASFFEEVKSLPIRVGGLIDFAAGLGHAGANANHFREETTSGGSQLERPHMCTAARDEDFHTISPMPRTTTK